MKNALSQFHSFFNQPATREGFARGIKSVTRHPEWQTLLVLCSGMPLLAKRLTELDEHTFAQEVSWPNESDGTTLDYLARVQVGLMQLLQKPELLPFAKDVSPELAQVLELPALGFPAYDYLLNESGYRMSEWPSLGVSAFHIQGNKVDAVFIEVGATAFHMERLALSTPPGAPATFGEELLAVNALITKAAELFAQCEARGPEYYRNAPAHCIQQFREDFRNAGTFDVVEAVTA